MLSVNDPRNPKYLVFKRILAELNRAVFEEEPPPNSDLVIDSGNYQDEMEKFEMDLANEQAAEAGTDEIALSLPLSAPPVLPADPDAPAPIPPIPPVFRSSFIVSSNVSRTIAATSQISHLVVNHGPTESVTDETELPLPAPRPVRAAATKKKNAKPTDATTPNLDTDNPAPVKRTRSKANPIPADPPKASRVSRKRG